MLIAREQLWNRLATLTQVAMLDHKERREVKDRIYQVLDSQTLALVKEKDQVELDGVTYFAWTDRL
jgi:hypothetical protein